MNSYGAPFRPHSEGRRPAPATQHMAEAKKETVTMPTIQAHVVTPCGDCVHQPICNRAPRLAALGRSTEVGLGNLPEGISVRVNAVAECDLFMRIPRSHRTAPAVDGQVSEQSPKTSLWTPERRAAQAELMRSKANLAGINAARAAAKLTGNVSGEPIEELAAEAVQ